MANESRHVNLISSPELQRQDTIISYDADSLVNAHQASIRVPRKLRAVSIRPSVQFPTEHIFQIHQCFGASSEFNTSDAWLQSGANAATGANLVSGESATNTTAAGFQASAVQSSVVTHDGETDLYNVDDIGQFGARAPVRPLEELVPVPVPERLREHLCFDEVLVVSVEKTPSNGAADGSAAAATAAGAEDPLAEEQNPRRRNSSKIHQLLQPDNLRHLGGMTVRINTPYGTAATPTRPAAIDPYNVYVAATFSHADHDGSGVVQSIQATVDAAFGLIKERRTEALCSRAQKDELYLNVKPNRERSAYDVQCVRTTGNRCWRRTGHLTAAQVPNFVLDGGGFLLMRYMVVQQFVGKLETFGMYVTGELCRSTYCFSRKANVLVNRRLCTVVKVRRCIWRSEYVPDVSVSLYLETGHLVRHTWQGCPYVVHVNPAQDIAKLLGDVEPLLSAVDERWREDVELWEQYLQMKNDRLCDLRGYVRSSSGGPPTALLRDYVYCLLRTKPRNVLEFTVKHFCGIDVDCEYTVVHEDD